MGIFNDVCLFVCLFFFVCLLFFDGTLIREGSHVILNFWRMKYRITHDYKFERWGFYSVYERIFFFLHFDVKKKILKFQFSLSLTKCNLCIGNGCDSKRRRCWLMICSSLYPFLSHRIDGHRATREWLDIVSLSSVAPSNGDPIYQKYSVVVTSLFDKKTPFCSSGVENENRVVKEHRRKCKCSFQCRYDREDQCQNPRKWMIKEEYSVTLCTRRIFYKNTVFWGEAQRSYFLPIFSLKCS